MTTKELLDEQTRVMRVSLDTVGQQIGRPAAVVYEALQRLQELTAGSEDTTKEMVKKGIDATATIMDILQRLQAVTEYRASAPDPHNKTITEKNIQAERTRVMIETLGAACHHLDTPVTVVHGILQFLETLAAGRDKAMKTWVKKGLDATNSIAEALHRLNTVSEYRTKSVAGAPGKTVIDIG